MFGFGIKASYARCMFFSPCSSPVSGSLSGTSTWCCLQCFPMSAKPPSCLLFAGQEQLKQEKAAFLRQKDSAAADLAKEKEAVDKRLKKCCQAESDAGKGQSYMHAQQHDAVDAEMCTHARFARIPATTTSSAVLASSFIFIRAAKASIPSVTRHHPSCAQRVRVHCSACVT